MLKASDNFKYEIIKNYLNIYVAYYLKLSGIYMSLFSVTCNRTFQAPKAVEDPDCKDFVTAIT